MSSIHYNTELRRRRTVQVDGRFTQSTPHAERLPLYDCLSREERHCGLRRVAVDAAVFVPFVEVAMVQVARAVSDCSDVHLERLSGMAVERTELTRSTLYSCDATRKVGGNITSYHDAIVVAKIQHGAATIEQGCRVHIFVERK